MARNLGTRRPHLPLRRKKVGAMSNVTAFPGVVQDAEPLTIDLTDIPVIMTSQELADVLRVSTKTVERMRERNDGPVPKRLPSSNGYRYSRESVQRWWGGLTDAFEVDAS